MATVTNKWGVSYDDQTGIKTPAHTTTTPGQATATSMSDFANQLPSTVGQGTLNITAPTATLPDFSSLPSIQSFVPQIRESGQLKLQSGLAALRSQYGEQNEALESQLAAAGTYDAGDKYKLEQRMFSNRGQEELQLISNIQAETLVQEVAEMQRQGQINEERARMVIDMSFQKAIQEGNWKQAAAIHNADMNMQINQYNADIIGLKADLIAKGNDALVKWAEVEIEKTQTLLQAAGLDLEQHKVDIAQYHEDILACGQYDGDVDQCLMDAKSDLDVRLGYAAGNTDTAGTTPTNMNPAGYSNTDAAGNYTGPVLSNDQVGWTQQALGNSPVDGALTTSGDSTYMYSKVHNGWIKIAPKAIY